MALDHGLGQRGSRSPRRSISTAEVLSLHAYLGELDGLGETWVSLAHPYTIPALLLGTELRAFTDAETGDGDDTRLEASIGDTRIGKLSPGGMTLLRKKWMAQWTGEVPKE